MAVIKTEAILLKSIPFSNSSNIIHFYTKEHGKIAVIAKGSRRMKSPFRGFLEPLTLVEIIYLFKQTREIQTLSKIENIEIYLRNNKTLVTTVYATAIIECLDKFIRDIQPDESIFQLTVQSLRFIDRHPDLNGHILVYFLLQLIENIGFKIDFHNCPECHHPIIDAYYHFNKGRLICAQCSQNNKSSQYFSKETLEYLNSIVQIADETELVKINLQINPEKIIKFLVSYLSYHIDYQINLKSLELLHNFTRME